MSLASQVSSLATRIATEFKSVRASVDTKPTRVTYTTVVPARPTGVTYVEWVGQVDPGANALQYDTWVPTA